MPIYCSDIKDTLYSTVRQCQTHSNPINFLDIRHICCSQHSADFIGLLTAHVSACTASRSINVTVSRRYPIIPVIAISAHFVEAKCSFRTIVNIRIHCVNQIELYNLKSAICSRHVKLLQQLPLRIVNYNIVRPSFTCPHIDSRLNYRLTKIFKHGRNSVSRLLRATLRLSPKIRLFVNLKFNIILQITYFSSAISLRLYSPTRR